MAHILLVPHMFEICAATIIMIVLSLWPVYICRELTDIELQNAYMNDDKCALELHNNLKLIKNDTVVEILQQVRDFTDKNITWLNIRNEYHYEKSSVNSLCIMLGFHERFGTVNSRIGSAHLLIPVAGTVITVFFLLAHIIEFLNDKDDISVGIQVFCGLICWLVTSTSLTIIDYNWNGTKSEILRNLDASFPIEWKICKYVGWFWTSIKIIELLLVNYYENVKIIIKLDKPIDLAVMDRSNDYALIDESEPPYPNITDIDGYV